MEKYRCRYRIEHCIRTEEVKVGSFRDLRRWYVSELRGSMTTDGLGAAMYMGLREGIRVAKGAQDFEALERLHAGLVSRMPYLGIHIHRSRRLVSRTKVTS